MDSFDLIVIGAGPGGYPAAIRAAQLGARTAIVEQEALGGTCLNWGCIPTKTLIAGADLFAHFGRASEYGIQAGKIHADYPAMIARKNNVVARLRGGVEQLLKANGVQIFTGTAAFQGRNRIAVRDVDGKLTVLTTKNTVIATGSAPVMPGFLPKHARVVDSRAFLDRPTLPASMIVLGGGVIGCEFACMAAQLGVKVTIVELLPEILVMLDADVRRELCKYMQQKLGIRILTGAPLTAITADDTGVSGTAGSETLRAELLLAALGRRPVTAGLEPSAAGVALTSAGMIVADNFGRTTAASIYAVGDVNGGPQLAHAATAQGIAAVESALGHARRAFDPLVPSCIFTAPEVAQVGLTEQQAQAGQRTVTTGRFAFASLGRALAAGDFEGFVKWVADPLSDQLLGATAIGPHATELIAEAALAIKGEWTAAELGRTIHAHPTFAEAWMESAHALHGACIHAAPKRH
ncbi:MAG: dihydrolipoyl dehydrogenase [bacterium]